MLADCVEVSITAEDAEWLAEFTRSLVEARLCASGNLVASIRSIYRWQGEIYDKPEARVALHTVREHIPEILRRVKAEHSYVVPGVVVIPIRDGNPEYLAWIVAETSHS